MFDWHGLQRPDLEKVEDWILRQYQQMYQAFFEQRSMIPAGRFHEMAFEQLEQDPVGEVRRLYEALDLPDFATFEPTLRDYVCSLSGYQKNTFPDFSPRLADRIADVWRISFEEWGYPSTRG
jgi:hypothetical protein